MFASLKEKFPCSDNSVLIFISSILSGYVYCFCDIENETSP